jgi:hypothetical protein
MLDDEEAVLRPAEGRYIAADGELEGEVVLPGFRCPLSELLD